jgi:hypothetical protein
LKNGSDLKTFETFRLLERVDPFFLNIQIIVPLGDFKNQGL